MIKKADIILAAVLIIAGLAMSYMLSFGQEAGSVRRYIQTANFTAYTPLMRTEKSQLQRTDIQT